MTVVAAPATRRPTDPAPEHAYTAPVVREIPPRRVPVVDHRTW